MLIASAILLVVLSPHLFHGGKPEFVKVKRGSLDVAITSEGELVSKGVVKIAASSVFKTKSNLIGQIRIKSIVPEGTTVRAGQEIVQLDRESIMQAVQAAAAEAQSLKEQALKASADTATQLRDIRYGLSTLKINMEISQINMEQSLYDPPAAQRKTKLEFDKSKIAYEQAYQSYLQRKVQAEANIVSLQQKAEAAMKKQAEVHRLLAATVVRAPKSGVVAHYVDLSGNKRAEGAVLTPEDLTVAVMPDITSLVSKCSFSEDELAKVKINQEAKVRVKILDGKAFDGRVSEISAMPSLRDGKKFYDVTIRLTNSSSELKPLMTTLNDIKLSNVENVLFVPKGAVEVQNGRYYVYTKDMRKQEVEVGGANSEAISVLKGVVVDEAVYVSIPTNKGKFKQINL